ncbi:MAG TPA: hypothetical protein VIL07_07920 [Symbiobacteriaceae bacterium]
MSCAFHPDRASKQVCSLCGSEVCEECGISLAGQVYCRACLEARVATVNRPVNSTLRLLFSVVPGLGHLYMGLFQRGMQLMAATALGIVLLGLLMPWLNGLFIPVMIFYSVFEAREIHLRLRQGLEVEDKGLVDLSVLRQRWHPRYTAYLLIGLGALVLYNAVVLDLAVLLFPEGRADEVVETVRGLTVGVVALGAGIWLLRRGEGQSRSQ